MPNYASLRTGVNGDATLHGPVGQGNTSTCTVCHDPTVYPASTFHHATVNAQNGNCAFCHSGATAADHTTMVADYVNCANCHAANVGSVSGAPVDPANNRVHDACTTCHKTDGSLKALADLTRGIVVAMPAGGTASNDGGGDCSACHGEYFPQHTHHFAATNDVSFDPTVDTSQPGMQPCSDCHRDYDSINGTTLGFSTFTQILWEHDTDGVKDGSTNTCDNCHNYDGSKSAPLADVQNAIGSGNPATCATCHTDKVPNVSHGGHPDTDFGWAGNCIDCHDTDADPATKPAVISVIHGNNCATCHVSPSTGDYTRRAGDPANGVDGDATLVDGVTWTRANSTCLTCHPDGSTQTGRATIHHDSKSGYAAAGNCAACHTSTGHEGDHSARVALYANCANCHTGTEGAANGMVVDAANARKHDDCVTCHKTDGSLKTLADLTRGIVTAMPAGGGDCSACHGEYFPNHQNIDHATSRVTVSANCANCHDAVAGGTAPDAITPPFTATGEAHATAGCATCHQANGALVAPTATAPGIAAGGGDCETCHGAYFPQHQAANHTAKIADTANCNTCHTATAGTATGAPVSNTDPMVHDGCATCHDTTTGLLLSVSAANDPNTAASVSAMTAGDCNTCHGAYFPSHQNADHTTRVMASANCANCHDAVAGGTAPDAITPPFTAAGEVHALSGCATCHNTTNGALLAAYGKAVAITVGDCETCHGQYFPQHQSPDHSAKVAGVTPCIDCHTATAGTATGIPTSATDAKVHDGCATCHNTTTGLLLSQAAANVNGYLTYGTAMAAGDCSTCHGNYFDHHVHGTTGGYVSHDVAFNATLDLGQADSQPCANCHNDAGLASPLSTWDAIKTEHATVGGAAQASACATCHFYATNGNQSGDPDTPPLTTVQSTIATGTGVHCLTCHTPKAAPATHGGHPTDFGKSAVCTTCHTGANVVADIHNNNCANCHNGTPSASTEKVGDRGLGDATLANGTAASNNWANVNCLTCHGAGYMEVVTAEGAGGNLSVTTYGGKHHLNAHAQGGDCDWCHDDPRRAPATDWESTFGVSGPASLPKQLACIECHVQGGYNNQASGLQINELAYQWSNGNPNSGYLTGLQTVKTIHSITSTSGQPIQVYNYGICLGCHNDTQKGRPVNVYHARPVAADMHLSGQDTADKSNGGDEIWSHTQYAQLHDQLPWPNTFKRFGDGVWDAASGGIADLKTAYGKRYDTGSKPGKNWKNNFNKPGAPSAPYNQTVTIPCNSNTNDWEGQCGQVGSANSVQVPYFSDIAPPGPFGPTAVSDSYTVNINSSNNSLAVMGNDSGSGISLQSVGAASHGTPASSGNTVLYTPTAGYTGADSFSYTIVDSSNQTASATVSITVVDPSANQPPAFGQASYTLANATENSAYSVSIAGYATDPEGDPISYSMSGGTCAWASVTADGTVSGTPGTADVGSCTITAVATATGGSDTATLNITVDAAGAGWPPNPSWSGNITQRTDKTSYWDRSRDPDRLRLYIRVDNEGTPTMRLRDASGNNVDIACTDDGAPDWRCTLEDNNLYNAGYSNTIVVFTGANLGDGSWLTYTINDWANTQDPLCPDSDPGCSGNNN